MNLQIDAKLAFPRKCIRGEVSGIGRPFPTYDSLAFLWTNFTSTTVSDLHFMKFCLVQKELKQETKRYPEIDMMLFGFGFRLFFPFQDPSRAASFLTVKYMSIADYSFCASASLLGPCPSQKTLRAHPNMSLIALQTGLVASMLYDLMHAL